MVRCPVCGAENQAPVKAWKYAAFTVEAYECRGCGTKFRNYYKGGKLSFTLKLEKGKGFVKA